MQIEQLNDNQQEALDEFMVDFGTDELIPWIASTYGLDSPTPETLEDDFKSWWDEELCEKILDRIGCAVEGEVEEQLRDLLQGMATDQVYESIGLRE